MTSSWLNISWNTLTRKKQNRTVTIEDGQSCTVGADAELCELFVEDSNVPAESFEVFSLQDDFYLQVVSHISIHVDGIKVSKDDGPAALKDMAIIKAGHSLILAEIGDKDWLDQRRLKYQVTDNERSVKRQKIDA